MAIGKESAKEIVTTVGGGLIVPPVLIFTILTSLALPSHEAQMELGQTRPGTGML
jgi:hypothetical protein